MAGRIRSIKPEILPEVDAPEPDMNYYADESDRVTYVYFVQAVPSGAIKIGKAAKVAYRISSLLCGSWEELRLVGWIQGGIVDERNLQRAFAADLIRREWFSPSQRLISLIKGLR